MVQAEGLILVDMIRCPLQLSAVLAAVLCAGVVQPAPASTPVPPLVLAQLQAPSEGMIDVRTAIDRVLARYVGTVIEAELKRGRPDELTDVVYELRLLTPQGNMLRLRVDAANGDILEVDGRGLTRARRPN